MQKAKKALFLPRSTLFQFVMSLFSPRCNFYNGQISRPLCSCPLAAQNSEKTKKKVFRWIYSITGGFINRGQSQSICGWAQGLILPSNWMRLYKFPMMAHVNSCWSGWGGWEAQGKKSIQGLLPLSTLPGVILTKAETRADHVCCDH